MTIAEDEGNQAVRDIRKKISAECANDPRKLIDHYLAEQEHYRERLLRPVAPQPADATERPSASR